MATSTKSKQAQFATATTIEEAFIQHEVDFQEACASATSPSLEAFLKEPGLASYYKMKTYVALGALDEARVSVSDGSHFYIKAKAVLEECRGIYTKPADAALLMQVGKIIEEEMK